MDSWARPIRRPDRPSIMAANALFLLAAAGILLIQVPGTIAFLIWPDLNVDLLNMNISVLYQLLLLLLPVLMYRRRRSDIDAALRLHRPRPKHIAIATGAALVGLLLANYITMLWMIGIQSLGGRLTTPGIQIGDGPMGLLAAMLTFALTPAVCEELLFRGAMLGGYERNGTARALILTSLLFALLHASVEGFPVHLMLGLVLGYLAVNTDSLYVSMTFHFVYNAGAVVMSAIESGSPPFNPEASLYYDIGGMAGVAQTGIMMVVMGVVFALLLLMASSDRETMGLPFGVPAPRVREQSTWQARLVLMGGVVTVATMMTLSVLRAMWVIG